MDPAEARAKAIEMRADWSKWLVALQAGLCTALWDVLKEQNLRVVSGRWLLVMAWMLFATSGIVAAFSLTRLPRLVERLGSGTPGAGHSNDDWTEQVWAYVQFALFAAGGAMAGLFILGRLFDCVGRPQ